MDVGFPCMPIFWCADTLFCWCDGIFGGIKALFSDVWQMAEIFETQALRRLHHLRACTVKRANRMLNFEINLSQNIYIAMGWNIRCVKSRMQSKKNCSLLEVAA